MHLARKSDDRTAADTRTTEILHISLVVSVNNGSTRAHADNDRLRKTREIDTASRDTVEFHRAFARQTVKGLRHVGRAHARQNDLFDIGKLDIVFHGEFTESAKQRGQRVGSFDELRCDHLTVLKSDDLRRTSADINTDNCFHIR